MFSDEGGVGTISSLSRRRVWGLVRPLFGRAPTPREAAFRADVDRVAVFLTAALRVAVFGRPPNFPADFADFFFAAAAFRAPWPADVFFFS
jgi:hypothetical protein